MRNSETLTWLIKRFNDDPTNDKKFYTKYKEEQSISLEGHITDVFTFEIGTSELNSMIFKENWTGKEITDLKRDMFFGKIINELLSTVWTRFDTNTFYEIPGSKITLINS